MKFEYFGFRTFRVFQLEERRSIDEAIWAFYTAMCNASIDQLRAEFLYLSSSKDENNSTQGKKKVAFGHRKALSKVSSKFLFQRFPGRRKQLKKLIFRIRRKP